MLGDDLEDYFEFDLTRASDEGDLAIKTGSFDCRHYEVGGRVN